MPERHQFSLMYDQPTTIRPFRIVWRAGCLSPRQPYQLGASKRKQRPSKLLNAVHRTCRQVEVRLEGETVWLSQAQLAELFTTSADNIGLHLKNIHIEQELREAATTEDFSVVRQEGRRHIRDLLWYFWHIGSSSGPSYGIRVFTYPNTYPKTWACVTRPGTSRHEKTRKNLVFMRVSGTFRPVVKRPDF